MTKGTHDLLYDTSLDEMNDKKANYLEYLLLMKPIKMLSLISIAFGGLILACGIAYSIINLSITPFAAAGILSSVSAGFGAAMLVAQPKANDYNITKQEYKEFVRSGGRKRIKTLLKEYRKNIKSNPLSDEEKEIVRLDILQNNLQTTKQEKLNTITEAQQHISEIDDKMSQIQTKKENLIKQLSAQKTTENAEQTIAGQSEENNTSENLNNIVQDGNIIEENNNKNV